MIRRLPAAALGVALALLVVGLAMLPLTPKEHAGWVARIGFDLDALRALRVWTMPLATLLQADPGLGAHFFFLLGASTLTVAVVEVRAGWRLALAAFFVGDWIASLVSLAVLGVLTAFGSGRASALLHTPDTGSSAAATGALAVAALLYRGRARFLLVGALAAWLLYGLFRFRPEITLVHVGGAVGGAAVFVAWRRLSRASRPHDVAAPSARRQ